MPVPCLRTGSARLRPTRPQAVEGAGGHSPSTPFFLVLEANLTCRSTIFNSPRTPPLDFSPWLTQTFFLECIAIAGDHRIGSIGDLAKYLRRGPSILASALHSRALRAICGRWHDRGVVAASSKRTPFARTRFPSSSQRLTPTRPTSPLSSDTTGSDRMLRPERQSGTTPGPVFASRPPPPPCPRPDAAPSDPNTSYAPAPP